MPRDAPLDKVDVHRQPVHLHRLALMTLVQLQRRHQALNLNLPVPLRHLPAIHASGNLAVPQPRAPRILLIRPDKRALHHGRAIVRLPKRQLLRNLHILQHKPTAAADDLAVFLDHVAVVALAVLALQRLLRAELRAAGWRRAHESRSRGTRVCCGKGDGRSARRNAGRADDSRNRRSRGGQWGFADEDLWSGGAEGWGFGPGADSPAGRGGIGGHLFYGNAPMMRASKQSIEAHV
jgi:hypothetical protein